MKYLVFVTFIMFICGCRSVKIDTATSYDSIHVEKLIPVFIPSDSSLFSALIKCNSSGMIAIEKLHIESSRNAQLSFILDSLGNIKVKTIVEHDTIYLKSDSIHIKETIKIPVEVEKKLSWWAATKIEYGGWAMWVLIAICLYVFVQLILKLKK